MKPSISLAIIMKNEESVLERCLNSFKDVVDEIVIIDTGSTDKSKEIAAKYNAKIFDFLWINDFSAARNFSFSKCKCDFILWCDCDDVIPESEKQKIKNLDYSDKEIVLCRYVYSHDEFGVSECTLERERIIKRSLNLQWQKPIHEYLPLTGKQTRTDIEIHHYKQHGSSERNLAILEEIVKTDKDSRNFYYLGKELADFGKDKRAIGTLLKFVKMNGWWEDTFSAYMIIAQCYKNLKDEENFFRNIFKSVQIEPRRAEPYYELGAYYTGKQDWSRAIHYFEECLNVKRAAELMSSYYPQYYTWKPALELCICYNNIGNIEKAHEYNELFASFRPNDSRAHNNRNILSEAIKKNKLKDGQGKKLNLGCGNKKIDGYTNVDVIKTSITDEIFPMTEIPYYDNTITTISSEHAVEHLSHKDAKKALQEFYRVLKPGGELLLYIPDLEECCRKYLSADNSRTVNYIPEKQWYKFTIYGIQRDENGSIAKYQFHTTGWSKSEIQKQLEDIGFIINLLESYNGWGTPSISIRAVKPISSVKVGWISAVNFDAAQTRIRVLNIDKELRSKGYYSKVVNYPEIINENYDIAIVGKQFDENHYLNIKLLKQHKKIVYCDICEDIFEFAWVKEIISICDRIICCSYRLEEKVKKINFNTTVIEDSYEV